VFISPSTHPTCLFARPPARLLLTCPWIPTHPCLFTASLHLVACWVCYIQVRDDRLLCGLVSSPSLSHICAARLAACGPHLCRCTSRAGQKKIRLYRDENGNPKGDARICYLRVESVPLALQMLDGSPFRPDHVVKVTRVCTPAAHSQSRACCWRGQMPSVAVVRDHSPHRWSLAACQ